MGHFFGTFSKELWINGYNFQEFCGIMSPVLERILQISRNYRKCFMICGIIALTLIQVAEL